MSESHILDFCDFSLLGWIYLEQTTQISCWYLFYWDLICFILELFEHNP